VAEDLISVTIEITNILKAAQGFYIYINALKEMLYKRKVTQ
jgi:hypothetical protein